jgi:hypothetical protein
MTTFSFAVQSVCLGVLTLLLGYTLWLMRSGRLNAHVTVRWVLAEGAAFMAVLLWRWLPLFSVTSTLGDRELLVVLAVVFFALIAFLILDCLVRISTHTHQIKLLTQELALLRESAERNLDERVTQLTQSVSILVPRGSTYTTEGQSNHSVRDVLLALWILACIIFYLFDISYTFNFFTANFKQ